MTWGAADRLPGRRGFSTFPQCTKPHRSGHRPGSADRLTIRPVTDNRHDVTYRAAGWADGEGRMLRPAVVEVRGGLVAAAREGDRVGADAAVVDLPDTLLLPGMVNAHVHLDLTTVGPLAYDGDFPAWLRVVTRRRAKPGPAALWSVRRGWAASVAAGVAAVGDVANDPSAVAALRAAGGRGVSYLETFGIGSRELFFRSVLTSRLGRLADGGGLRVGVTPHAPYTCSWATYARATRLGERRGMPLMTHLAETPAEAEFVADATGPYVEHLRHYGTWDDRVRGVGASPVQAMEPYLKRRPWLLAHCNYVDDDDIATLAETGASVAYCPAASAYFGHDGHRYRDMLDAGVNVCLGTDSIICQAADARQPCSILDQMRLLYRRDAADPRLLVRMATANGWRGLGLSDPRATLSGVRIDRDDPTDPLTQALRSDEPVRVLVATGPATP